MCWACACMVPSANYFFLYSSPTYNYDMYPPMHDILTHFSHAHFEKKKVVWFGSYGWAEGSKQKTFTELTSQLSWEVLGNLSFLGQPDEKALKAGYNIQPKQVLIVCRFEMGKELARQVKAVPPKQNDSN